MSRTFCLGLMLRRLLAFLINMLRSICTSDAISTFRIQYISHNRQQISRAKHLKAKNYLETIKQGYCIPAQDEAKRNHQFDP